MNDNDVSAILEPVDEEIEEWERGLTPVERFERLVEYGQVSKVLQNTFFRSLDKAGQVDALTRVLDNLIHQLDRTAQVLLKYSTTHPEGVKINRLAVELSRVKVKLLDDFAKGIDVVGQPSEKAKGKRFF